MQADVSVNSLPTLSLNYSLDSLNTMNLPSVAEAFGRFRSLSELQLLLEQARSCGWPVTILGGGSNILLDRHLAGLVLQSSDQTVQCMSADEDVIRVRVGAGKNWHQWVCESTQYGHGLENLALIPGTVGAAPIQNIGAYGVEVGECIDTVIGYQISTQQLRYLSRSECRLGYRDSVFKRELAGDFVVLSVVFALARTFDPILSYGPLKAWQEREKLVTPEALIQQVSAIRSEKLPDPARIPNAGSFFKNPMVSAQLADDLVARYPGMPRYSAGIEGLSKLAAGWLIEQAGWKGRSLGRVRMHDQQALVMTSDSGAELKDVLALQQHIQQSVLERFGVHLEREPVVLGSSS